MHTDDEGTARNVELREREKIISVVYLDEFRDSQLCGQFPPRRGGRGGGELVTQLRK